MTYFLLWKYHKNDKISWVGMSWITLITELSLKCLVINQPPSVSVHLEEVHRKCYLRIMKCLWNFNIKHKSVYAQVLWIENYKLTGNKHIKTKSLPQIHVCITVLRYWRIKRTCVSQSKRHAYTLLLTCCLNMVSISGKEKI